MKSERDNDLLQAIFNDLLQAIFNEMQELKRSLSIKDERRVSVKEFAQRMGYSEPTLWDRINNGVLTPPQKDGVLSFWLNSYVNEAVATKCKKSAKVAA